MSDAGTARLVLVLGPGRSGTSAMAGVLAHGGYAVPKAIAGNETNPAGFFEPGWVVSFHKGHLQRADVRTLDTDPAALVRLERSVERGTARDELRAWLASQLGEHPRLVIKDPRLVWFKNLWSTVAEDLGLEPRFLIMLRHPAEVSSSRSTYYHAREVAAVGGWVNVALMTEALTRGTRRALVQYSRLTQEWRPEVRRVCATLGITLEPGPEVATHPLDDFIDPALRRMKPEWTSITAPVVLEDLAEQVFASLSLLTEEREPSGARAALDELRVAYDTMHGDALSLVAPTLRRVRLDARRKALRQRTAGDEAGGLRPKPPGADETEPGSGERRLAWVWRTRRQGSR